MAYVISATLLKLKRLVSASLGPDHRTLYATAGQRKPTGAIDPTKTVVSRSALYAYSAARHVSVAIDSTKTVATRK